MSNLDSNKSIGIYLIIIWAVINLLMMLLLIPGDAEDINNYLEVILWGLSIPALLVMRKTGAAFAIVTLCITLSTSMGILLLAYYEGMLAEAVGYVNALRIIINIIAIIYMFKLVFAGKFR
jgi:hypothetical protein